jgi:hypothetical protein
MGWKKGQSGNPGGRPFGSDKLFVQALRMELAAAGENLKELRAVARALIDEAKAGNIRAIQELGDRLDGRPTQMLAAEGSRDRRKLTYEIVHVIEEREQVEAKEDRDLLVDYSEIKTNGNGNGADHADSEIVNNEHE